jgi:hypothetical protein
VISTFRVRIREQHHVLSSPRRTEGNLDQGRYCDLQHATGRSLQGRQTDTRLYAFGAGVCYLLLISQSCLIDTPETAYLYDPSVQNSRLDFCFCQVRRCHLLHSTSRMHAHVLLHIQSYIHSFISLYIVLANPTLTFFGQEDQTAYYISATTSAIE